MQDRHNKTNPEKNGFTIMEVMIALVIFSVGILAILGMQVTSIKGNHISYQFLEGTNLGASTLENMAGLPYTHSNFNAGSHGPIYDGPNNSYRMDWTVTNNTDDTKTVSLTIQWTKDGDTKSIAYDFLKGQDT